MNEAKPGRTSSDVLKSVPQRPGPQKKTSQQRRHSIFESNSNLRKMDQFQQLIDDLRKEQEDIDAQKKETGNERREIEKTQKKRRIRNEETPKRMKLKLEQKKEEQQQKILQETEKRREEVETELRKREIELLEEKKS